MSAKEFWVSSGHHLLDRANSGGLVITDDFLKLYLARPEILPPAEACEAERQLHARLMIAPRDAVSDPDIAALADADARENWRAMIAYRDHLLKHATLEAAYHAFAKGSASGTPPMMLNQLVHAILRNIFDDELDSFQLRAAETFFRPQRLSIRDGQLLLADDEVVEGHEQDIHSSPLAAMFAEAKSKSLDILSEANANQYHSRSDAFDMVLDFGHAKRGRAALARVMERWIGHFTGIAVTIAPFEKLQEKHWSWFIGLDAEATKTGNALWNGENPGADAMARIAGLFRLDFPEGAPLIERMKGQPVWLILAATPGHVIRIKPQNLLAGLPLAERG